MERVKYVSQIIKEFTGIGYGESYSLKSRCVQCEVSKKKVPLDEVRIDAHIQGRDDLSMEPQMIFAITTAKGQKGHVLVPVGTSNPLTSYHPGPAMSLVRSFYNLVRRSKKVTAS